MNKFKLFFIWQDGKEEAWLNNLSVKGLRLDTVSFPFTYHFSPDPSNKYTFQLNALNDAGMSLDTFKGIFYEIRLGTYRADERLALFSERSFRGKSNRVWNGATRPKRINIRNS